MIEARPLRVRIYLAYTLFAVLLISFVAGYVLHEGDKSSARADLDRFHIPAIKTFQSVPFKQALLTYSSATTPLFHIVGAFGPLRYDQPAFYIASTVISVVFVVLFAVLMLRRFGMGIEVRAQIVLFSAFLLISPYYRTQAFWTSTDNMAIWFMILTFFFLNEMERSSKGGLVCFLGAAVASVLTFYTRQTYLWLVAYTSVVLLFRGIVHRAWIAVLAVLLLPGAYLFYLWKALTPPYFQEHHTGLTIAGIAYSLFSVLVLAVPFLAANPAAARSECRERSRWIPSVAFGVLFALITWRMAPQPFLDERLSGVFIRALQTWRVWGALVYFLAVAAGGTVTFSVFRRVNWQTRALMFLLIGSTIALRVSFQRYYDPMLLIVLLSAVDREFMRRHFTRKAAAFTLLLEAGVCAAKLIH